MLRRAVLGDRVAGLDYHGSLVSPPAATLWG